MLNVVNLSLEVTKRCNFKCRHCLKGEAQEEDLDLNVIAKIFKRGVIVQNLQFTGGEVFMVPDLFHKIVDRIISSGAMVNHANIVTNGTYYTKQIEQDLRRLSIYISRCNSMVSGANYQNPISLELSDDEYHQEQIEIIKNNNPKLYNQYKENLQRLIQNNPDLEMRCNEIIFDKGRARDLDIPKYYETPSKMLFTVMRFINQPLVEVSNVRIAPNGNVKDTDDNVLNKSIEEIVFENGIRCADENEFFREYQQHIYDFQHPKRVSNKK